MIDAAGATVSRYRVTLRCSWPAFHLRPGRAESGTGAALTATSGEGEESAVTGDPDHVDGHCNGVTWPHRDGLKLAPLRRRAAVVVTNEVVLPADAPGRM